MAFLSSFVGPCGCWLFPPLMHTYMQYTEVAIISWNYRLSNLIKAANWSFGIVFTSSIIMEKMYWQNSEHFYQNLRPQSKLEVCVLFYCQSWTNTLKMDSKVFVWGKLGSFPASTLYDITALGDFSVFILGEIHFHTVFLSKHLRGLSLYMCT